MDAVGIEGVKVRGLVEGGSPSDPDGPVGVRGCSAGSRSAGGNRCFDRAEVHAEVMLGRGWQISHGKAWGKRELNMVSSCVSDRSQRRDSSSAITFAVPGM